MTTQYQAVVLDVSEIRIGSELKLNHSSGLNIISLYSVSEFSTDGGQVEINGVVYSYSTKSDDDGTLTLAIGLVTDLTQDEEVWTYPASYEKEALIQVEDEGGVMVRVPHNLYDALDSAIRLDPNQESVLVHNEKGDWVIDDVIGQKLSRSGQYLDPDTMPPAQPYVPTEPPTLSPTPALIGNIKSILGTIPLELNTQAYNLYLSTSDGDPQDIDSYVGTVISNQFQISSVPPSLQVTDPETGEIDDDLKPGVVYYVSVVASNAAGVAPASPWTPVMLRSVGAAEISADYAYLGEVSFDQMKGGTFSSVVNWSGLFTTRDTEFEAGAEIDPNSYRGYGLPQDPGTPAPLVFEVPFDGRPNYFAGDVEARKFTAYEGADFYGDANNIKANGGIYLESGSGGAVAAATIVQSVPSVALNTPTSNTSWGEDIVFNPASCYNLTWDASSNSFVTVQNSPGGLVYWNISTAGVVVESSDQVNYRGAGFVRISSTKWAILMSYTSPDNVASWGIQTHGGWFPNMYTAYTANSIPTLGLDQDGNVRVAETVPSSGGTIRIRRFSVDAGGTPTWISTNTTSALVGNSSVVGSIGYGAYDFNNGAAHHVIMSRGSAIQVRVTGSSLLTEQPEHNWSLPTNMVAVAMNANPSSSAASSGSRWFGFGMDKRLYTFGPNTWMDSVSSRHVIAVTMATSTSESQVGSKTPVTLLKRYQYTITAPTLVSPATRSGVYVWRGATGLPADNQMIRQGYTVSGTRSLLLTSIAYSGSAPGTAPTSAAYPTSSPGWVRSQYTDSTTTGMPNVIDLRGGNAPGRLGPLHWDSTLALQRKNQPYRFHTEVTFSAPSAPYDVTNTVVDLGGMSITFTSVGVEDTFEVIAVMDISTVTGGTAAFVGNLKLDTVVQSKSVIFSSPTTGIRATVTQNWKLTNLAAGSHTIVLTGSRTGTASSYRVQALHTNLSLKRTAGD